MRIDILTLFPDTVGDMLCESILGRAQERGHIRVECHQIRDYTKNRQKQVDDYPYGGGLGMVMQADPLFNCWEHVASTAGYPPHTVLMTPSGKCYTQEDAKRLSRLEGFIIVCGHYEGVDERFIEECVDEELSIGDFVLTGGEIPALAVADSVARLIPGVLKSPECFENESHWQGLLEHPHYSRPEVWRGRPVPEVLLSGHHANIERWRRERSLEKTLRRRPDMLSLAELSEEDLETLEKLKGDV